MRRLITLNAAAMSSRGVQSILFVFSAAIIITVFVFSFFSRSRLWLNMYAALFVLNTPTEKGLRFTVYTYCA